MRYCLLLVISLTFGLIGKSQTNSTYSKASDSDPKAKKILDNLKKKYDSYKTMEVLFELAIEIPGKPIEVQKGKLLQEGKKYVLELKDQEIYCDAKVLWMYLKDNKEVQINDYNESEDDGMLSPKEMLRMYENGKYAYAITGTEIENGINTSLIEFKPLDKKSEYSKLRLSVDPKANKAVSLKVFSKDGSRFTLSIKKIIPNKVFTSATFVFNPKKYPGVKVEDLRID